ncbi:hypothetical protein [Kordia sp.]|uniref:tetratricopeptide repeat protein n=1 Tax=Kordia sp. TaxID=1965332 RepID=UPI0025C02F3E|nr:hypothetical protein [Kordia sp.]MCH2194455.1 hypothetical protein [Kordia sp.]
MNKEEFIQDYIADRLSDEDKVRAEELLKTDVELQELYESHLELTAAFQISNDKALKKHLQELDANTIEATDNGTKKSNFGMLKRIAIAAIFIIGAFFAINQFSANGDIFDSYFEVCPNTYLPITRGTSSPDATFEAFKSYESGNYLKAEKAFKDLLSSDDNPNIRFYYAMSLLNQEKSGLALKELNILTRNTNANFDYQLESFWYVALIQFQQDKLEDAVKNLQVIQRVHPNFKAEEIKSILEKL